MLLSVDLLNTAVERLGLDAEGLLSEPRLYVDRFGEYKVPFGVAVKVALEAPHHIVRTAFRTMGLHDKILAHMRHGLECATVGNHTVLVVPNRARTFGILVRWSIGATDGEEAAAGEIILCPRLRRSARPGAFSIARPIGRRSWRFISVVLERRGRRSSRRGHARFRLAASRTNICTVPLPGWSTG